ncbi:MAG: ATP-dependent helicase [Epsilonproteobacteria bacterium]|nr:MAG: ATP-dependent helicase [Campylobacterota bacterium]
MPQNYNFANLNEAQIEAVKHIDGSMLILAGAGSGKTLTITNRLAYLISLGIDPMSIVTLTFTNKAATQMRHRAFELIGEVSVPPLLCTFHKFGLLFLKLHMEKLGRKNSFMIIDTDDKKRIIRSFDKNIDVPIVASKISKFKNNIQTINDARAMQGDDVASTAMVYEQYENYLEKNNLVDFDDLLLLPFKILDKFDDIAKATSEKYKYIMVDEYQDTNMLQYKLLCKLCCTHDNICVVGDDDQSIYEWRGATIKNILNFEKNFKNTKVIKLEKNYRSTTQILKYANLLIEHNQDRLGKKLIGTKEAGEKPKVYESIDERLETQKIIRDINTLVSSGEDPNDIAILYRVNALSRQLEDGLSKAGINYKLIGGKRFYERMEIKDLVAYFRTIVQPNDNFSFKRIVNVPKRGIGKTTINKLDDLSKQTSIPIFELLDSAPKEQMISLVGQKNYRTLKLFVASIQELLDILRDAKMTFIDAFEDMFEIQKNYKSMPDGEDRIANIDEFYALTKDYFLENSDNDMDSFLNKISLSIENNELQEDAISLLSIHASKGLEYKHIFIVGLEEGFFPHLTADICEERRLGYVAFTRAKTTLTLSFVHNRFYKGRRTALSKSRFLSESGLVQGGLMIQKSKTFKKGDTVKHEVFGLGVIDTAKVAGKSYKLKINFGGIKRDILSDFVKLM